MVIFHSYVMLVYQRVTVLAKKRHEPAGVTCNLLAPGCLRGLPTSASFPWVKIQHPHCGPQPQDQNGEEGGERNSSRGLAKRTSKHTELDEGTCWAKYLHQNTSDGLVYHAMHHFFKPIGCENPGLPSL